LFLQDSAKQHFLAGAHAQKFIPGKTLNCVVISLGTGDIGLCILLSVELSSNCHLQILVNSSYNNFIY